MLTSLYEISLKCVVKNYSFVEAFSFNEFRIVPDNILFDINYSLYEEHKLCLLALEIARFDVFVRMLRISNKRLRLLKCFQALIDEFGLYIADNIVSSYLIKCNAMVIDEMLPAQLESNFKIGMDLATFFNDAGLFLECTRVLSACKNICLAFEPSAKSYCMTLHCCKKLLYAQSAFALFDEALETQTLIAELLEKHTSLNEEVNLASLFTTFSFHSFMKSDYKEAYFWSTKALKELNNDVPPHTLVETFSQASKACVLKREFQPAEILIKQAVYLAREIYGPNHPKYADILQDYGFFLLNSDSILKCVNVYKEDLRIKEEYCGNLNINLALSQENLAYILYVHEYSSGNFSEARTYAESANSIMERLLPPDHYVLASAQRVKALILEELALDINDGNDVIPDKPEELLVSMREELLKQAEQLHLNALRLTILAFGEANVQTAKHFGNLGRLYQSMKRLEEAESMHKQAISIKEKILGENDYEVGLSVGHLASLYNYHMEEYRKAEILYFRSLDINTKLFGLSYSGLEYDYKGLINIYEKIGDDDKYRDFNFVLYRWMMLRERLAKSNAEPVVLSETPLPVEEVKRLFFETTKVVQEV